MKILYATCPLYHWGEVPEGYASKVHDLKCGSCGREMEPKLAHPVTQGWSEDMKVSVELVAEDGIGL